MVVANNPAPSLVTIYPAGVATAVDVQNFRASGIGQFDAGAGHYAVVGIVSPILVDLMAC